MASFPDKMGRWGGMTPENLMLKSNIDIKILNWNLNNTIQSITSSLCFIKQVIFSQSKGRLMLYFLFFTHCYSDLKVLISKKLAPLVHCPFLDQMSALTRVVKPTTLRVL